MPKFSKFSNVALMSPSLHEKQIAAAIEEATAMHVPKVHPMDGGMAAVLAAPVPKLGGLHPALIGGLIGGGAGALNHALEPVDDGRSLLRETLVGGGIGALTGGALKAMHGGGLHGDSMADLFDTIHTASVSLETNDAMDIEALLKKTAVDYEIDDRPKWPKAEERVDGADTQSLVERARVSSAWQAHDAAVTAELGSEAGFKGAEDGVVDAPAEPSAVAESTPWMGRPPDLCSYICKTQSEARCKKCRGESFLDKAAAALPLNAFAHFLGKDASFIRTKLREGGVTGSVLDPSSCCEKCDNSETDQCSCKAEKTAVSRSWITQRVASPANSLDRLRQFTGKMHASRLHPTDAMTGKRWLDVDHAATTGMNTLQGSHGLSADALPWATPSARGSTAELGRMIPPRLLQQTGAMEPLAKTAACDHTTGVACKHCGDDPAEAAYWKFDADRDPMRGGKSERDAFKMLFRSLNTKTANDPIKKKIDVCGVPIHLEWLKGTDRVYKSKAGKETFRKTMKADYGYIPDTLDSDGEELDVYVGPEVEDCKTVYVINQVKKDGSFDEHKVMVGYPTMAAAKASYLDHMGGAADRFDSISAIPFKALVALYGRPDTQTKAAASVGYAEAFHKYAMPGFRKEKKKRSRTQGAAAAMVGTKALIPGLGALADLDERRVPQSFDDVSHQTRALGAEMGVQRPYSVMEQPAAGFVSADWAEDNRQATLRQNQTFEDFHKATGVKIRDPRPVHQGPLAGEIHLPANASDATLAHELGHARNAETPFGQFRNKGYDFGNYTAGPALAHSVLSSNPGYVPSALHALASVPQLMEEGSASMRALRALTKRHGVMKGMGKSLGLLPAFGTYAAAAALPAAVTAFRRGDIFERGD